MVKIRLRQVLAPVLALVSLSVTCSLAFSAPINCSLANDDVEKTICSRPSLIAQDKAISDKLAALELACPSLRMLLSQAGPQVDAAPSANDKANSLLWCLALVDEAMTPPERQV